MCRFWKVLISDNIISKVSSRLAASFQECLCHSLSRHIPCTLCSKILKPEYTKSKLKVPGTQAFVVKTQIPVWWRSLMWRGEILATAHWADAPVHQRVGHKSQKQHRARTSEANEGMFVISNDCGHRSSIFCEQSPFLLFDAAHWVCHTQMVEQSSWICSVKQFYCFFCYLLLYCLIIH